MKKPSPTRRSPAVVPGCAPRRETGASKFPIVGVGASAGGLEALEELLGHVPEGSGWAFIIVQHLDPTRRGMLPELLRRSTVMKVVQVKDRTRVQPNRVYVIPPNKDLSFRRGVLRLLKPTAPRGQRLPIDFLFRSLARDLHAQSIGVILSGMGSDGTLGARAIKEQAGLIVVQEPGTARFDSMPRSVVSAGLADGVAPVKEIPARILSHLRHLPVVSPVPAEPAEAVVRNALDQLIVLLRARTGQDFSHYKRNTLHRRMERRMGIHALRRPAAYVHYLKENPQEVDLLFKELLIGVTRFFRDTEAWEQLAMQVLPGMLAGRVPGRSLRAWVPGCSTGEEAYSLAIAFREAAEARGAPGEVALQIFATDLDPDAIEKARQGLFAESLAADVSAARLARFFTREERGYRVQKSIREMVIFAPQNLVMDPPFTKLDLLCCRNLLIYLTPEVQAKLIPLFHYSLVPGGVLFLGIAETIGKFTGLFTSLAGKSRIFRRLDSVPSLEPVEFPTAGHGARLAAADTPTLRKPPGSLQGLADQVVLQRHAPPAVLVNDQGDILYICGRTGKYLEPAAGKANWNLFAMAREGLRYELSEAFQKALRVKEPVLIRGLRMATTDSESWLDLSLECLRDRGSLHGLVLIVFKELPPPPLAPEQTPAAGSKSATARTARLEGELHRARLEARAVHEAMQTTQEELRSANEEMQSTNEELQSANEELTTSKEEMQSLNEELQTLNTELQAKVDELSRASNDMKNLLDSTDIATLFLDRNLRIRRFTAQTTTFIKLIPGDVGRPITDLVLDLGYPALEHDVHRVLRTLLSTEKLASARDGRWFNVRILPYRTMDERIDGVVITFADVTTAKVLELKLRAQQAHLEERVAHQKLDSPAKHPELLRPVRSASGPLPPPPPRLRPRPRRPGLSGTKD